MDAKSILGSRAQTGLTVGLFVVACLASNARGQARGPQRDWIETDRPGVTFSPWTMPARASQLELGTPNLVVERGDGKDTEAWNTPFLLRYGISDRAELRLLGSGWNWLTGESGGGSDTMSGFGDLELGTKISLTTCDGWCPQSALIAGVRLPTGAEEFSTGEPGYDATWVGEWYPTDFEALRTTIGIARTPIDSGSEVTGSLTTRYRRTFDERWAAHAELGYFPGFHDARDLAVWGIGVEVRVTKDIQLDLAGDFALNDATPDANVTAGFSIRF